MPKHHAVPDAGATNSPNTTSVLTIASQKGGSSKTTLAVHLAVHAQAAGLSCLLIDMDPQESASRWYDRRASAEPALVTASAGQLPEVLDAAREDGRALIVIDTPPHAGAQIDQAVRAADLVLVPCKPTPMDLDALPATAEIIRRHGTPAGVILTSTPPRSSIVAEARAHLAADYPDLGVLIPELGHRAAYYYALIDGRAVSEFEPDGKAAAEIAAVYAWVMAALEARVPTDRIALPPAPPRRAERVRHIAKGAEHG